MGSIPIARSNLVLGARCVVLGALKAVLNRLTVSNLAVVERAEVEFGPGLNVITGETGAGKSVLMGALELLLGGRSDADVVRDGAKEAEVEAEFDDKVVRRTVTSAGRSRAWVDDESVSVAELKELGRTLVDVHGPRANQSLLEEEFQREALDAFGRTEATLGRYGERYAKLTDLKAQAAALRASASGNVSDEADMLRYQVDELDGAHLSDDDETIAERHAAAAHAGEIVEGANEITEALGGDEGAAETLIRLQPKFAAMAKHFPAAADWGAQAEELTLRLQELSRSVADAASGLDADVEDLDELDARLTLVNRLLRKYGVRTVADLRATLERKRARLSDLENLDGRLAALDAEIAAAEKSVRSAGAELTKARRKAAAGMAEAVTRELRDLGFLQSKFSVELGAADPEPHGCDRVTYMFEPNPGESARPLAAIASSGEIARVMLALKAVSFQTSRTSRTSRTSQTFRTLVFDEVDANIGGEIGRVVGEKMRAVACGRQVIAITHLPQCAVCGDRHLVVSKSVSGGRTRTRVVAVEGEERVSEIARMLGGDEPSGAVKAHAKAILKGKGR